MAAQLKLVGDEQQGNLLDGVVKDPVLEVFEYWKALMDKERSQLGHVRRENITRALRMGYSVDDLKLAIVGCKYDAWSQGQNQSNMKYNDIELICRDETKIDRFIEFGNDYMARAKRKEDEKAEQAQKGVAMPDYVREKLKALLEKHRRPT